MKPISSSRFSIGLRVWHWLNALVVLSLLATYFLRKTLFSVSINRQIFVDKLAERELVVDINVGKDLARAMVDRLWVWHVNLGYALAALVVVRLILLFIEKTNPLSQLVAGIKKRNLSAHAMGVKLLYTVFYLVLAAMVLSGLTIIYGEQMGLSEKVFETVEEFHENAMWFLVAFAGMHVAGVIVAELTSDKGLVSRMIHGGK